MKNKTLEEKIVEEFEELAVSFEQPKECGRDICTSCPEMKGRADGVRRAKELFTTALTRVREQEGRDEVVCKVFWELQRHKNKVLNHPLKKRELQDSGEIAMRNAIEIVQSNLLFNYNVDVSKCDQARTINSDNI